MPNKVSSNSIKIFPSSNRSVESNHYTDNFVTEYNLSSIVNKLLLSANTATGSDKITFGQDSSPYEATPTKGFVISDSFNKNANLEFNINGYFVSVAGSSIYAVPTEQECSQNFVWFDISGDYTYALIQVNTSAGSGEEGLYHLEGEESKSSGTFTPESTHPIYCLPILKGVDANTAVVNPVAKLRLTNFAVDDGELK